MNDGALRDRGEPGRIAPLASSGARAPATRGIREILPHPPQREISIQELLVWAYREEMVHAAKAPGLPVEMTARKGAPELKRGDWAQMMALGTGVDTSVRLDFEAPADAYRVEAAVLALSDAHAAIEAEYLPPVPRVTMDEDPSLAPVVARSVTVRLPQLVFEAAISGGAPDWLAEPSVSLERKRCVMGKDWRARRGGGAPTIAVLQIIEWHGDLPWIVGAMRARYGLWCEALAALRVALTGTLERFVLTDVLPVRRPWSRKMA